MTLSHIAYLFTAFDWMMLLRVLFPCLRTFVNICCVKVKKTKVTKIKIKIWRQRKHVTNNERIILLSIWRHAARVDLNVYAQLCI